MQMILMSPADVSALFQTAIEKTLAEFTQKLRFNEQTPTIEKPVTQAELAKFLGVTEQTLGNHRNKGKIPFIQIGSRVLYKTSEVIRALEVNQTKGRAN